MSSSRLGVGQAADTTADLELEPNGAADRPDHAAVVAAAAGGIEVYQVQPRRPQRLELDGGPYRVARVVGGAPEVTLCQAHRASGEKVDGGKDQHKRAVC